MKRTRLLWMSDAPTFFTGFGTVTNEILSRLRRSEKYDIACVGWGYNGWPYNRECIPFDIYPSPSPNLGKDTLPRILSEFQPDIFVTLGDVWMVDWLAEGTLDHRPFKYFPYIPLDGVPLYRPWIKFLKQADRVVTCSNFGRQLVQDSLADGQVQMIYHGVDSDAFYPLDNRQEKRPAELRGKFIIGCVARNQPRKNLPILIKSCARFFKERPDAILYLHTNPDDIGWDILDLLHRYGIFNRTCISKSASIQKGVNKRKLNEIYNLFDVMVLPTGGEGFGLPILEAMAAGVPVIATGYSSCTELLQGRGELVAVKEFVTVGRHNIDYAIPDLEDLLDKLSLLYERPDLRQEHAIRGRQFAETLDWRFIADRWDRLFTEVAASAGSGT